MKTCSLKSTCDDMCSVAYESATASMKLTIHLTLLLLYQGYAGIRDAVHTYSRIINGGKSVPDCPHVYQKDLPSARPVGLSWDRTV